MSLRGVLLLVLSSSAPALAEGGWVTARGRLQAEPRLEVWGATRSVGAGLVVPSSRGARQGVLLEGLYGFRDRTAEVRGGRVWQLTASGIATASATVAGAATLVPDVGDAGFGPHATLALGLGGQVFTVDLSLATAVELFQRGTVRFPQRATLGLNLRVGSWGLSAQARLGLDLIAGANFVGRGELLVSVAWFGLPLFE